MKTASEVKNSNRTRTLAHETRKNKQWLSILVIVTLVVAVAFVSCGGGSGSGSGGSAGGKGSYKIKMTTEQYGECVFRLFGSGIAMVDWGDGSENVSLTISEYDIDNAARGGNPGGVRFTHTYPNESIRTITIYGDNITGLQCLSRYFTSLDVSKNTALTILDCGGNQLTSLDVSKNSTLTQLGCSGNQLTSLDVSKNTALTHLYCNDNQLTKLDVSKNTALTHLGCSDNQLSSLDVNKNTALTWLSCEGNQLTRLDMSKNTVLTSLGCERNQFTGSALNALFGTLHNDDNVVGWWGSKGVYINNNPGENDCDRSIATNKGWRFTWN